ncbi:MAG: hypothetical protein U9N87_04345 [Planctomycetota bacterium]|nr:hypothetical protein [Planctomycetota bacterium]
MKKTLLTGLLAVILLAVSARGAMTYSAGDILKNAQNVTMNNRYMNPLYLWANEIEGIVEGTTGTGVLYLTPTDTEPGTDEGLFYADDSENILKYYNGSAWVSLGSGTFTGGSITSDITMSDGEYLRPTTTTAHATGVQVYDVDGTAWENALIVTNGDTPAVVLGDVAATLAISSSGGLNADTAGAVTGVTSLAMGGALSGVTTLGASGAVTADSLALGNGATLANSTDTEITFGENAEDLAFDFGSDSVGLKSSTGVVALAFGDVDALSGINTIALDAAASSLSLAADGAADDLTISVTGAQDASLVLSSAGTAADALQVTTTAGGIDITNGGAAEEDLDITSSNASINLTAGEDAAGAINVLTNTGTSETMVFTNTQGTGAGAIDWVATAGGITLTTAAGKTVTVEGSITLENGQIIEGVNNNRIEFTENSETLGLIFDTDKIELAAGGTGVATIDFNDVDALEDIESITGDGTGALGGFLKTVTVDIDDRVLTTAESGHVLTNGADADTSVFTLPTAAAGLVYTFVDVEAAAGADLCILANTDDKIQNGTAAQYYNCYDDTYGSTVTLVAVDATEWVVIATNGTWTADADTTAP